MECNVKGRFVSFRLHVNLIETHCCLFYLYKLELECMMFIVYCLILFSIVGKATQQTWLKCLSIC